MPDETYTSEDFLRQSLERAQGELDWAGGSVEGALEELRKAEAWVARCKERRDAIAALMPAVKV